MSVNGSSLFDRVKAQVGGISPRRRRDYLTFLAFIAPNFILFGVFTFWPFIYSFILGLTKWNMIGKAKFIQLGNYQQMLEDPVFWQVLKNTVLLAFGVVVVSTPCVFVAKPPPLLRAKVVMIEHSSKSIVPLPLPPVPDSSLVRLLRARIGTPPIWKLRETRSPTCTATPEALPAVYPVFAVAMP